MISQKIMSESVLLKNPFLANLKKWTDTGRIAIIAEIKARSAENSDLLAGRTVYQIAQNYIAAGAACLSVVTGKWFGGSAALLREAVECTGYPVLRKDFITNRHQVDISAELGASAVLLTAGLLQRGHLEELAAYVAVQGLVPFIEISKLQEVQGLQLPVGSLLAVNNKNICNRERGAADFQRSLELVTACRECKPAFVVSASGIEELEHVRQLKKAGFDAFLIGTALLKRADLLTRLQKYGGSS